MIFILIGHRGSGKTTVLKELQTWFSSLNRTGHFWDLDQEIETQFGPIAEVFNKKGEEHFRRMESEMFAFRISQIQCEDPIFISVGAGFQGLIPDEAEVIWVRRESDSKGRIFLNRPRLNKNLSPLEEWFERFPSREELYHQRQTQTLTLPEGHWMNTNVIRKFFSHWFEREAKDDLTYDVTLLPQDIENQKYAGKRIYQQSRRVEVREDLLKEIPMEFESKIYFSHRLKESKPVSNLRFPWEDWEESLGQTDQNFWSYSSHSDSPPRSDVGILKWAPDISDFSELLIGHQWFLQDPQRRAFLPRSEEGRWRWYRQIFGPMMPLHFIREHKGSCLDQPFWYESQISIPVSQGFAAVLGNDVSLSWSPSFHTDFFHAHQMSFVAVSLSEDEFEVGFEALRKLGLKAAAITTPFKKRAFDLVTDFVSEEDKKWGSINTLYLDSDHVSGLSTDHLGLKELYPELSPPVVIWGGGGLWPLLKEICPQAQSVPARQGGTLTEPCTLIWASRRSDQVKWPEPLSFVKKVIDMNYFENSMGRELALKAGCDYESGEEFFVKQARFQQSFWAQKL